MGTAAVTFATVVGNEGRPALWGGTVLLKWLDFSWRAVGNLLKGFQKGDDGIMFAF